jgi:2-polyprenyl-3-methyl-5-hydroxy-6-metoxy-1,4-benzoquinol methylase
MKFESVLEFIPIAYESLDFLNPWGTAQNNSVNPRFNEKCYKLFSDVEMPLKVLDMGCSGGGFVKNCVDDGCIAIGVEGSDYSQKLKRAEWKSIPDKLFTCDITKPFNIKMKNGNEFTNLKFDLVTCWEVMEHIKEADIEKIALNVKELILPTGLWIMSISTVDDFVNGVNLHETVKPANWWIEKFELLGLHHRADLVSYFSEQYIRGNRYNGPNSFHLILSKDIEKSPLFPNYPLSARIYDKWRASKAHKLLNMLTKL